LIVLDESLMGLLLDRLIIEWYPGRVCYITDLRPGTLIKDESIPSLLQQVSEATFVTTNVSDFWRHIPAHRRYSILCVALPNERLRELPALLRRTFRLKEFKTKASRMGKVARVSDHHVQYYEVGKESTQTIEWPN
jgi:hypothetical protein